MKKRVFNILLLSTIICLTLLSINLFETTGTHAAYANGSGAPGGNTNSPGDGANCTQCHTNAPLNNFNIFTFNFSSNVPAGGYVPGQTYTITIGVMNTSSNRIGFEATAEQTSSNNKVGTMVITDATRTATTNGGTAVTHTAAGTSSATPGANAWQFDWTAPVAGTGQVTFYGIYNVSNGNFNPSGDELYTRSFIVEEAITTSIDVESKQPLISIYPNPAAEYINISSATPIEWVELINASGKIVYQGDKTFIDMSEFAQGMYFARVKLNGEISLQKILKQ